MFVSVNLYSEKKGEVNRFLSNLYNTNFGVENNLSWKKQFSDPVELAEIIGIFIDNSDEYFLSMWVSLDKNIFVHITKENGNEIIKYLYERFPY